MSVSFDELMSIIYKTTHLSVVGSGPIRIPGKSLYEGNGNELETLVYPA